MAIKGLYECFNHWHEQGTVWIISDTHFNDTEVYSKNKNRPNTEDFLKLINSKVGKKDTLIHLGDVGDIDALGKVKGYKVLIAGNHDTGLSRYKRHVDVSTFPKNEWDKKRAMNVVLKMYPNCTYSVKNDDTNWIVYADNNLFDEVYSGPLFISDKIVLSHEPINMSFALNLHGHIHNKNHKDDKNHINFCCDVKGYEPINFNKFMKEGHFSKIPSIHRDTIDRATVRKRDRLKV